MQQPTQSKQTEGETEPNNNNNDKQSTFVEVIKQKSKPNQSAWGNCRRLGLSLAAGLGQGREERSWAGGNSH